MRCFYLRRFSGKSSFGAFYLSFGTAQPAYPEKVLVLQELHVGALHSPTTGADFARHGLTLDVQ